VTAAVTSEARHARPFAEILTRVDDGNPHAEATCVLADLVQRCRDTGKAGSMTVKVTIKPIGQAGGRQMGVSIEVDEKPPKYPPSPSVFFADDSGSLSRENPDQPVLDGLHVVEPKTPKEIVR
jgi:hypothetical protein